METKEQREDRIDAHREAQTCSICGKHLNYGEGWYTANHSHYGCQFPAGAPAPTPSFRDTVARVDQALANLGLQRKREQAPLGEGGPSKKLIAIIEISAKEHFDTQDVQDVRLFLPSPVWRQLRFDVQRVEGTMRVDGREIPFSSWHSVKRLIQYKRVTFDDDWPCPHIDPVLQTRRSRRAASAAEIVKTQAAAKAA